MDSLFIGKFKASEQELGCEEGERGHSGGYLSGSPRSFQDLPGGTSPLFYQVVLLVAVPYGWQYLFKVDVF